MGAAVRINRPMVMSPMLEGSRMAWSCSLLLPTQSTLEGFLISMASLPLAPGQKPLSFKTLLKVHLLQEAFLEFPYSNFYCVHSVLPSPATH